MDITVLKLHNDPDLSWLQTPVATIDQAARTAALERQNQLTKPPGSLGRLESLAVDFAGWQGTPLPSLDTIQIRVFAGDHGIARVGVSAFPQAVTGEMIANFARGGAAISVLAQQYGADFQVVNMGTATPLPAEIAVHPQIRNRPLMAGTGNICAQSAMDRIVLAKALQAGASEINHNDRTKLFIGGEMGIGNTAVSAALVSLLLKLPAEETVGRGTGVDDIRLAHKREAVNRALALHGSKCASPLDALRRLGGLEIAALTGAYISAAQRGIPSLVDGYICTTAALLACQINPGVRDWLLFGHRSAEPGHRHLLTALAAEPLLDLQMRLGEGSGAAVAIPLLQSALALHRSMATFGEAGVSEKESVDD
ncbi:MAG: nicotinate-nucleotide--dimethylbenzimidazole phosphoribosyltransferase [Porticoccaceae bacterium]|nr:nicotinate-nucleotide--dimethylbenzimidazole phosphoribosyltransferase [Porticoccaceae bacterium]